MGCERRHGSVPPRPVMVLLAGLCGSMQLSSAAFILKLVPVMTTCPRPPGLTSPNVALHARGGGRSVSCEDVKKSIMKRRAVLDKDLRNLEKYDKIDKGHARELDTKTKGLETDLARWDRLGCGPDDDVDKVRTEIAEAKEVLDQKRE
ncbi:unnamed protein product [Effrenium voratum]|nr:unnamed protein product [Effrenium voratum]